MVCLRNEVGPFYEELFKAGELGQLQSGAGEGGMVAVVAVGPTLQHQQSI